jgi:hypothetical protein
MTRVRKKFYTIKEVCEIIGVSEAAFRRHPEILPPTIRIGRSIRILPEVFDAWLEKHKLAGGVLPTEAPIRTNFAPIEEPAVGPAEPVRILSKVPPPPEFLTDLNSVPGKSGTRIPLHYLLNAAVYDPRNHGPGDPPTATEVPIVAFKAPEAPDTIEVNNTYFTFMPDLRQVLPGVIDIHKPMPQTAYSAAWLRPSLDPAELLGLTREEVAKHYWLPDSCADPGALPDNDALLTGAENTPAGRFLSSVAFFYLRQSQDSAAFLEEDWTNAFHFTGGTYVEWVEARFLDKETAIRIAEAAAGRSTLPQAVKNLWTVMEDSQIFVKKPDLAKKRKEIIRGEIDKSVNRAIHTIFSEGPKAVRDGTGLTTMCHSKEGTAMAISYVGSAADFQPPFAVDPEAIDPDPDSRVTLTRTRPQSGRGRPGRGAKSKRRAPRVPGSKRRH